MTKLEVLGFEVAVERLLGGNRGLGRLLSMLVDESPRAVPYSRLQHARVNLAPNAEIPRNAIIVRTSKLRSALSDLGLPKTVIINVPGVGYRINKQDAAKITAKVLETL